VDAGALAIVALVESSGDPEASSPAGAVGLMQLMPRTAARIAEERKLSDFEEERLRDPATNLDFGAYYFAQQLSSFGGDDAARSVELAAAAYNAGPRRVRAYLDGGATLPDETSAYKDLVAGMWRERQASRSTTYDSWREGVRARAAARAESPLPGARVTQAFSPESAPATMGERRRGYPESDALRSPQAPASPPHTPHEGVDLAKPPGTPIQAPLDGTVARAEDDGDHGKVIVLEHGNGIETRYHHLGGMSVQPGQRIGRGEIIGTVGATGKVTGPHLHFEVRDHGAPIDPAPYLRSGAEGR
jgi:murein DD-endopeptidase MepM/ murein hydrolase activator NlpD